MKNRYTNGHKGFITLLEEDWDRLLLDHNELIIDDPEIEYIEDEKLEN